MSEMQNCNNCVKTAPGWVNAVFLILLLSPRPSAIGVPNQAQL